MEPISDKEIAIDLTGHQGQPCYDGPNDETEKEVQLVEELSAERKLKCSTRLWNSFRPN